MSRSFTISLPPGVTPGPEHIAAAMGSGGGGGDDQGPRRGVTWTDVAIVVVVAAVAWSHFGGPTTAPSTDTAPAEGAAPPADPNDPGLPADFQRRIGMLGADLAYIGDPSTPPDVKAEAAAAEPEDRANLCHDAGIAEENPIVDAIIAADCLGVGRR